MHLWQEYHKCHIVSFQCIIPGGIWCCYVLTTRDVNLDHLEVVSANVLHHKITVPPLSSKNTLEENILIYYFSSKLHPVILTPQWILLATVITMMFAWCSFCISLIPSVFINQNYFVRKGCPILPIDLFIQIYIGISMGSWIFILWVKIKCCIYFVTHSSVVTFLRKFSSWITLTGY